jgi:mRNA interferase HigB
MRFIAKRTLRELWQQRRYADVEQPLKAWHSEARKADWTTPQEIKVQYRNASFVQNNRVVFNIAGNKYRLIVKVNYAYGIVYVRFIGTHRQYDAIDAETI